MSFNQDIVARAKANGWFREVLSTGPNCQVVVMSIPPGGEIGEEVHDRVDQVLVCVEGEGLAVLEGERSPVHPGHLVHVPAGTRHNLVNAGAADLKLYTVYAPPSTPGHDPSHEGRGGRERGALLSPRAGDGWSDRRQPTRDLGVVGTGGNGSPSQLSSTAIRSLHGVPLNV